MEEEKTMKNLKDEEKQAKLEIWNYAYGYTPLAVVKCAIELQIADVLETHGGAMTLADLSAAVGCSPPILRRIMRYLVHRRFFEQSEEEASISYTQTPLSKMLVRNGENSMADAILLGCSPPMLATWHRLSSGALENGAPPFQDEHGKNVWEFSSTNPAQNKLFNDGMASYARQYMQSFIDNYPEAFAGIGSLVDVGGCDGTALRMLVKAFPWIHGINFDLPHVVSVAPHCDGIEHVAGNMFDKIPKGDSAFLMRVLHDWGDKECVKILNNCRDAILPDTGKVIIVEAVIVEGDEDKYSDFRLALDMVMLASTDKGKERTFEEWEYIIKEAGFAKITVKNIEAIVSVIEAYP